VVYERYILKEKQGSHNLSVFRTNQRGHGDFLYQIELDS